MNLDLGIPRLSCTEDSHLLSNTKLSSVEMKSNVILSLCLSAGQIYILSFRSEERPITISID